MYHSENTCAYDFHGPCCCLCAAGRKILRVWALRIAISSLDRCLTRWNFSIRFQRLPNHNGRHPLRFPLDFRREREVYLLRKAAS